MGRRIRSNGTRNHARTVAAHVLAAALPALATALYWLTGPAGSGGDEYIPLAGALLHGALSVPARSWIELVPVGGSWYVPFPPAPVLFYLPVIAAMGVREWWAELSVSVMPALLGGASVALAYWLLVGWRVAMCPRLWITAGFASSTLWWVAGMGGTHLMAQVAGVFFTLAALNLAVRQHWPLAAGLLLGLAAASRLPMGLALPVLLAFYGWRPVRGHAYLLAGVAVPALVVAAYNLARFGSPLDMGYARIPGVSGEWWFADGLLSLSYLPRSLYYALIAVSPLHGRIWMGIGLALSAPMYLLAFRARGHRMTTVILATGLLVLAPDLLHGSWGFAQWGWRFILDAAPLLLLALGVAYRDRISLAARVSILTGALVTAVGFALI